MDWDEWLRRWEAQQGRLRHREHLYDMIVGALLSQAKPSLRIADLGCGPGSLSAWISEALPNASLVGFDFDPVLLELGRNGYRHNGRIVLLDRDLTDPALADVGDDFDAVVSTTALHWLRLEELQQLYRSVAAMLKPGGILLNGDWIAGLGSPAIDELMKSMRGPEAQQDILPERSRKTGETWDDWRRSIELKKAGETWDDWWHALRDEPALRQAFAEREQRGHKHPWEGLKVEDLVRLANGPTVADHIATLRDVGFAEIGSLWQHKETHLLIAIR